MADHEGTPPPSSTASPSSSISPTTASLISSSASGIISRLICHPLDTIKSRLQSPTVHPSTHPSTLRLSFLNLYNSHGARGMYRGLGASIIGGTPGTVLYLTSYDAFSDAIKGDNNGDNKGNNFGIHLAAGMMAEAVACVVYVPVDVVKERCQVSTLQAKPEYSSSLEALRHIMKNEGLRGVYRGYGATLLSFGPFSGLYFGFYENFKSHASSYYPDSPDLPFLPTVTTSVGAGLMAAWLTTPLDLAKLRMQVVRGAGDAKDRESYSTLLSSLKTIINEGGVKGLWRGATARCAFFAPATGVTMTTYDMFKSRLS